MSDLLRPPVRPLHRQIEEWLRGRIDGGELRPGDAIPTEQALSERFDVSRAPVRQALAVLTFDGLIQRFPGRGSFVARPKIGQALNTLRGLAEELREQGLEPEVEVLDVAWTAPSREARLALRLASGDAPVLRLDRRVRVDGQPLLWDRSYFAGRPALPDDRQELGRLPLFSLIESDGVVVDEAEQTIEAVAASHVVAGHLDVPPGSPVLMVRRVTLARPARPVIFTLAVYRGDRYRYRVALKRRSGGLR